MLLNPCCCSTGTCDQECCNGGKWPDQINCDIGTLGWVDNGCDVCDTIGGSYVLTYDAVNSNPLNNCIWTYSGPDLCTYLLDCTPDQNVTAFVEITAILSPTCTWTVFFVLNHDGGDDSCPNPTKSGTYAGVGTGDCDGLVLSRTAEITPAYTCTGTFPATIELSR
jgi:hypothetical protein